MQHEIATAFAHRQCPETVTLTAIDDTLRADALFFANRDWRDITAEAWTEYSDAFYGLSPEAFLYFLPSILSISLDPSNVLLVADALVTALDTSANPDIWSDWFSDRFKALTAGEIEVLKVWAAAFLNTVEKGEGSEYRRVHDTLTMLELARQR